MVVAKVDQCLVIEQVAAEAISHPKALHNHNGMKKKKKGSLRGLFHLGNRNTSTPVKGK